jgi:DNA-binding response OmpR family regulator
MNSVTFEGTPVKLTAKEMLLLELFLQNPQKTFTKANLYETVWEDTYYYEDNTINVHMSNLRSKLKKATGHEFIETVWGIGYKLNQ